MWKHNFSVTPPTLTPSETRHEPLPDPPLTFNGLGLEAMPIYETYFRKYGIIRAVQLAAPKLQKLEFLQLPANSILHYLPEDEMELGMPTTHPVLRNYKRLLQMEHITELGAKLGPPRPMPVPAGRLKREYHRQNLRVREMLKPETVMRDPQILTVSNYSLLNHLFRYPINYFRSYYKWWNIQAAVWKRVGEWGQEYPRRHQFLITRLPTILPTLPLLLRAQREKVMTRNLLPHFVQPESLLILEVWKWLSADFRNQSVLAQSKPEAIKRMHLIFMEGDRWISVNLGLLDQWRKRPDSEGGNDAHKGILDPFVLQKRFLRLLMSLMEVRSGAEDNSQGLTEEVESAIEITPSEDGVEDNRVSDLVVERAEPVRLEVPNENGTTSKIRLTAHLNLDRLPEDLVEETEENIRAIDEAITKDLEALDHIAAKFEERLEEGVEDAPTEVLSIEPSAMIEYQPEERSLAGSVMAKVDQQADAGLMSGAEYRRMAALSTAYQRLNNPFGEGTLEEMLNVSQEDLMLPTESQIPDMTTVPDKSMLKSTILDFDRQYLEKVYRKDIVRMVLGLQHAGVAVTGFSVEEYQDALNHYEKYAVQLTPVVGKVSTVYFKLPKIRKDGTYIDNGTRNRLRKQRGDKPIRKLSPSRVALTSYYNKVFVNRSEKQVNNYPGWLTNQIVSQAVDESNTHITHAMLANVADTTVRTPRVYSIMATRLRSFHCGEYKFFFDYHARKTQLGTEQVEALEKDGLLAVGKRGKNLLLVDETNTIYEARGDSLETLGTLETLLGIEGRAPVEMAEIRVFGKQIPVGVFLAYHLGLTNLFKLLDVTPRRVPTGTRAHMSEDEIALRFEDEMWIFPQDRSAKTLILAGLAAYERYTRNYSSHLFDRKDIYFNVLDQTRISVRYLREMDLMTELFVDPITEEILKEMKEPTDFIGLVIRSCELLESDWSPLETDMEFMRIKGYERMAGAVYAELSRAVRQHRARGGIAKAKIDLHPEAVWMSVSRDPAVKIVEESNPVHNVREREEVTFSGVGGRSARSMVGRTRVFHPNDTGVISESTKDSADVAITTFTTADPTLVNVRGVTRRFDPKKDGIASIMSSPALLSPGADRDD